MVAPVRIAPRFTLLVVAGLFVLVLALVGVQHSSAQGHAVVFMLNPVADTYLGTGRPQDRSKKLVTGWTYAARAKEYRAYVSFPIDPEKHPATGLRNATLSLYPSDPADTSQIYAVYIVRKMAEPLTPGRRSGWFATTGPEVERQIETRSFNWKSWDVTDIAADMVRDPEKAYGFEISGKSPADNTKLFFLSIEGAQPGPDGYQPTLLLQYDPGAFPTATSSATRTPKPTTTPVASHTPQPSATSTRRPTASPTATSTATATPVRAFVPRADR